jgi:hypothetical protein
MYSEMDTYAFLAYAKAHQQALLQQAEMDALRRRAVLQKQGKAPKPRRRPALLRSIGHCQRAVRLRGHTLWQRWIFVARARARGNPSQAPRTSRG